MERRRLTAVFVIIIKDCVVVDVVVLERDELPISGSAEANALLRPRTMTDRLEHHFAADDEFDGLMELPRRRDGERTMRPWPKLAAKARTNKLGDDADVLLRQPEHLREYAPKIENALGLLINRQH